MYAFLHRNSSIDENKHTHRAYVTIIIECNLWQLISFFFLFSFGDYFSLKRLPNNQYWSEFQKKKNNNENNKRKEENAMQCNAIRCSRMSVQKEFNKIEYEMYVLMMLIKCDSHVVCFVCFDHTHAHAFTVHFVIFRNIQWRSEKGKQWNRWTQRFDGYCCCYYDGGGDGGSSSEHWIKY